MDGILLIDKPSGWTSFDVVAKVRGIIKRETGLKKPKVGHTGTLDPLATGLLVLVLGSYTKRVSELSKVDKTYEVTMKLGQTSTTGDEEGERTKTGDRTPETEEIEDVFEKFVGEIEQIPPAYSAIKINGQRAYKLARAGKEVKIEPRKATIHEIKPGHNLDKNNTQGRTLDRGWYEYPEVRFTAKVSSGTYIRTLVEDMGTKLGTGAYMSNLRRTQVGDFSLDDAVGMENLSPDTLRSRLLTN
jgi:tRNA pseudouridine55 synthase